MKPENEQDLELKAILNDKFSGSSTILDGLAFLLRGKYQRGTLSGDILTLIKNKCADFSTVRNFIVSLEEALIQNDDSKITEIFNSYISDRKLIYETIANSFSPLISGCRKIITLSNSKTIVKSFEILKDELKNTKIVVSESRPLFEGRILAEELSEFGYAVELITEAQIPGYLEQSDAAVVGADKIFPDGSISNKVGSRLIALLCKTFEKPFFVLADSSKLTKNTASISTVQPESEIWEKKPDMIQIKNLYFETVDSTLITQIITEK